MTGNCDLIQHLFARFYHIDKDTLKIALDMCQELLSNRDIHQLAILGIPKQETKKEVLDFIYNETVDIIPIMRKKEGRKYDKAVKRLTTDIKNVIQL